MRKYILISKKTEGYLVYGFDKLGYLCHWGNCTRGLSEDAVRFMLQQLGNCLTFAMFKTWALQNGYEYRRVQNDLSFDRFWSEYDVARNKLEAKKLWDGIKADEELQYIFYSHDAYRQYCTDNPWYTKMYPDTFLRKHRHDEWYKIKPNDRNLTK